MATSFGIVRQANGFLWVYSEPGTGSTFKIYLPEAKSEARPVETPAVSASATGTETVLAVDDDPTLLAIMERTLRGAGYRVLTAGSVDAAVAAATAHVGAIDLVITDVMLPGVSGVELPARLRGTHPAIRILFTSGYTEGSLEQWTKAEPAARVVEKPFTPRGLLQATRDALSTIR